MGLIDRIVSKINLPNMGQIDQTVAIYKEIGLDVARFLDTAETQGYIEAELIFPEDPLVLNLGALGEVTLTLPTDPLKIRLPIPPDPLPETLLP